MVVDRLAGHLLGDDQVERGTRNAMQVKHFKSPDFLIDLPRPVAAEPVLMPSTEILIPIALAALILSAGTLLRLSYADRSAAMTERERQAEDASHDSDQIW